METDLLYSEIERLKRENYKLKITIETYKEKELESYRDLFSEYQGYLNNLK